MSVNLSAPREDLVNVANATWLAIVDCARAYEPNKVHPWDGTHDGDTWSSEELTIMADRLEQTAKLVPVLRELAKKGGVEIW